MPDDVVRLLDEFVPVVEADPLEHVVAGEDDAAPIGSREEQFLESEWNLIVDNRKPGTRTRQLCIHEPAPKGQHR